MRVMKLISPLSSPCKVPPSQPDNAPTSPVHTILNIGCNPNEFEDNVRNQIAAGREILENNSRELERSHAGNERTLDEVRDDLPELRDDTGNKVIFLNCIVGFGALAVCGLFAATLYYKYSELFYQNTM